VTLPRRRQVLFNPGPVNLDSRVKDNLFNMELCHRQPEFEQLHQSVGDRLLAYLGADRGETAVSLMHGSGTLAVDAALATFVRGRVLVVDNGLYCRRLLRTLAGLEGVDARAVPFGIGQPVDVERVAATMADFRPQWLGVVHHETTTGILNPLAALADMAVGQGTRLLVDAVSSLGAHPIPASADVVCFNSSKCLESLPGIAGVAWRRHLESHPVVPVLDVTSYGEGVPSTPNVQAFVALDVALDILAAEDRPARYREMAETVWEVGGRCFEPLLAREDRSHVLTSFRLEGRDPDRLFRRALDAGFVIYHGQRHLRHEIFRVANMGAAVDRQAVEELFGVLGAP
jgi:2-aminoethylphosphonate-pyruvate transaminase